MIINPIRPLRTLMIPFIAQQEHKVGGELVVAYPKDLYQRMKSQLDLLEHESRRLWMTEECDKYAQQEYPDYVMCTEPIEATPTQMVAIGSAWKKTPASPLLMLLVPRRTTQL